MPATKINILVNKNTLNYAWYSYHTDGESNPIYLNLLNSGLNKQCNTQAVAVTTPIQMMA